MKLNISEKILKKHLEQGDMKQGNEIGIKIDQTLTQDSTGTMAYLQLEAIGIEKVETKKSVAYIDHNMLQSGPENFDDHLYIQSMAKNNGIWFSKPGNGICHQVHLERFGVPGDTLIGSDSHTPTAGGLGMLAIGAGGVDVAAAMAGASYFIKMPEIIKVELEGTLRTGASAKDIILEVLQRETVKGGVNKIYEYSGEGVKTLSIPERATITNMGAELGATTSIFPSDELTLEFLKSMGREEDFVEVKADKDAKYYKTIKINLNNIVPMAACPHSPDNVVDVSEIEGKIINQVAIGSCTNSSYLDLAKVANIIKGKKVHPDVSLVISPGSRQILKKLADEGILSIFLEAGARILECGCGPCIGMGQAPCTNGKSLRTFNRNFKGRSGTVSADVYLVSPETAAISAIYGVITNPLGLEEVKDVFVPKYFEQDNNLFIKPNEQYIGKTEIIKGPNIKAYPKATPIGELLNSKVLTKLGDNITTDHIMPSNAKLLPYRSNIPYLADYCLTPSDKNFPNKAKEAGNGIIIAGENYGQGSSREHAALVPLYLGVKAIIAKSFARIHKQNLINNGILPLVFENNEDYDKINENDLIEIDNLIDQLKNRKITIKNISKSIEIETKIEVSKRQEKMLLSGGLLAMLKESF